MNYIKIRDNYINLNRVTYFKVDSCDYGIAFYYDSGDILVIDFDTYNEYSTVLETLELFLRREGSIYSCK